MHLIVSEAPTGLYINGAERMPPHAATTVTCVRVCSFGRRPTGVDAESSKGARTAHIPPLLQSKSFALCCVRGSQLEGTLVISPWYESNVGVCVCCCFDVGNSHRIEVGLLFCFMGCIVQVCCLFMLYLRRTACVTYRSSSRLSRSAATLA